MRNQKLLLVAAVGLLLAHATIAIAQEYTQKGSEEFQVGSGSSVILKNLSGDINVLGWDRNVINVEWFKRASGTQAQLKAELVKVLMDRHNGGIEVKVDYPDDSERRDAGLQKDKSFNVSVDFTVRVPRDCETRVHNVSGDVEIGNIAADISVRLVSGDLTASNLSGEIDFNVTSGEIVLNSADGEITAHNTSGNIELTDVSGQVEAETTSGDITVLARELRGVELKVLSGDVNVSTEVPVTSGRFDLSAFSGNVVATLPSGSAFDFEAKVFSGRINCEFDFDFVETKSRHELKGTVGGGGAGLRVKIHSGSVTVKRR